MREREGNFVNLHISKSIFIWGEPAFDDDSKQIREGGRKIIWRRSV